MRRRLVYVPLAGLILATVPLRGAYADPLETPEPEEQPEPEVLPEPRIPLPRPPLNVDQIGPLPAPVRAMIEAAIATGDQHKVNTVIEIARITNPAASDEINAMADGFRRELALQATIKAQRTYHAIRTADIFDHWSGRGELGANRTTGNTDEIGLTARLSLNRKGIDWTHKLLTSVGYQSTSGKTSKEQLLASYEPNYRISPRLFGFGLSQYERDRFQGFTSRVSVSGGIGYHIIAQKRLQLAVKGGPAFRHTAYTDAMNENNLSALAAMDLDWRLNDGLKLTQDASAYLEDTNSTISSITGLEAKISSRLAARLSYTAEHNTAPPIGAVNTDTRTRITVIYDF